MGHVEVAFFIGSKNPIKTVSNIVFEDKSKFDCPASVPFCSFNRQTKHGYLGRFNQSQGIHNPLLSIFARFVTLLHFLKGLHLKQIIFSYHL